MIGCLILGTFVAVGAARLLRHHHGHGGPYGGHWRGGFAGPCGRGMRGFHRHGGWGSLGGGGWGPGAGSENGYGYGYGYDPRHGSPFGPGGGPASPGQGQGDDRGDDHGDEHGWSGFDGRWPGRGGGFILGSLLAQLRATATQERVIRTAFDEFRAEMKEVGGGEAKKTRQDIGAAMRTPQFDEVFMGELFARQDSAIEKTRKAFVGLMARVHDVLDEEQRGRLANLVEKGPRFWRRGFGW
jgi:hypothetical protein